MRLFVVGLLMIAAIEVPAYIPYFWATRIILCITGVYLMVWATLGKGRWCRTCKRFSIFHHV